MDIETQPIQPPAQKNGAWKWIVVIVVIAIVAWLIWWWVVPPEAIAPQAEEFQGTGEEISPEVPEETLEDTTPVIDQELESIDSVDLEAEFESIDRQLENL